MNTQHIQNENINIQNQGRNQSKIAYLQKRIAEYESGHGQFVVIPLEAGFGKSRETARIISEYITNGGTRRFLIVKKFKEDVLKTVRSINECQPDIYSEVAKGIISDEWQTEKKGISDLVFYQVLVITHKRYQMLCKDAKSRMYFTKGRHTLIIDEAMDMPLCEFSMSTFEKIQSLLQSFVLKDSFRQACDGLIAELSILQAKNFGNRLVMCQPKGNERQVNQFAREVKENHHHIKNYNLVQEFVDSLYVFYQNECIFNGGKHKGRITTFDSTFRRWGLRNNIILDANGMIDQQYKVDRNVKVDRQTLIIDHSNWKLYHVDFNSSDSNIQFTLGYFDEIAKLIAERKKIGTKTLVVTREKHVTTLEMAFQQYNVSDAEIAYFGNILGKNDWRDFNQVWIVATPNYPAEDYVLKWSRASGKRFNHKNLQMTVSNRTMVFSDAELEAIRFGCIVGDIYQAVKRINRHNDKLAEVFIMNSNPNIIDAVRKRMKNIHYGGQIHLNVEYRGKRKATPRNTRADKLSKHLMSLPKGVYAKQEIREAVGIDEKNFSTVLKDVTVKQLVNLGYIQIAGRTIEVLVEGEMKHVG